MGVMEASRIVCAGAFFSAFVGLFAGEVRDTTIPLMVASGFGWAMFDTQIKAERNNND